MADAHGLGIADQLMMTDSQLNEQRVLDQLS